MGTSFSCIENKNNLAKISHVLLHSGRKLSTDFTSIEDDILYEVSKKTRACVGAHVPIRRVCVALAKSTHFELEILLLFLVHVIDPSRNLTRTNILLAML